MQQSPLICMRKGKVLLAWVLRFYLLSNLEFSAGDIHHQHGFIHAEFVVSVRDAHGCLEPLGTEDRDTRHRSQLLLFSFETQRRATRMHTDWLHQAIATCPQTTPRDPVKALLTTDLRLSRTEERLTKPGRRAGAHPRPEHSRM